MQPAETFTVEYNYTVPAGETSVTNKATITATTEKGSTITGDDDETTQVYTGTLDINLAPIVIYTGGTGSKQTIVVDKEGGNVPSTDSGLPTFGVTMQIEGSNTPLKTTDGIILYDISGNSSRNGFSWKAIAYNDNATTLMQLDPQGETKPVRIELTDKDDPDATIESDHFDIGSDLYKTYTVSFFADGAPSDTALLVAEINGAYYQIHYNSTTLTVRGTTSSEAPTTSVVHEEKDLAKDSKYPQALIKNSDAEFYYVSDNSVTNNTDNTENSDNKLKVHDTSSVSLLTDEIVNPNVAADQEYVQKMKDEVMNDKILTDALAQAQNNGTAKWRFYYMDLVLADNGNAVLTTPDDVIIYWPYSDNTLTYEEAKSGDYTLQVVHYVGLNRNYTSSAFGEQLSKCSIESYDVQVTEKGLCFKVPAKDGFSPFALVWAKTKTVTPPTTEDEEDTTTPTATATPAPTQAPVATPAPAGTPAPADASAPAAAVIPQTGDSLPVGLLGGAAALAAAAFVVLFILRRRKQ